MIGEVFIECRCVGVPHNTVKVKMLPFICCPGNTICVKGGRPFLDQCSWFADLTNSEEFAGSQIGNYVVAYAHLSERVPCDGRPGFLANVTLVLKPSVFVLILSTPAMPRQAMLQHIKVVEVCAPVCRHGIRFSMRCNATSSQKANDRGNGAAAKKL